MTKVKIINKNTNESFDVNNTFELSLNLVCMCDETNEIYQYKNQITEIADYVYNYYHLRGTLHETKSELFISTDPTLWNFLIVISQTPYEFVKQMYCAS
jgi:hypothetical protein